MLQFLRLQAQMTAPLPSGSTPLVSLPLVTSWYKKVGGECRWGNHGAPPADAVAFLQRVLQSFRDQERMESMDEDPLQEHATKCLGDFLVVSSLTMTKMQKLKEAASQDALQIKGHKHCETTLYLEAADLPKAEQATKKLLFEKSQEAIRV